MLRLRPYNKNDAEIIMSWIKGENAFYKWTAGVLGEYPISAEQFNMVSNLMAFTAIDDNEIVGFFTMRRPNEFYEELRFGFVIVDSKKRGQGYGKNMLKLGLKYAKEIFGANKVSLGVFENNESAYYCYKAIGFEDVSQDEIEKYTVMGEEWNCLEMEMKLLNKLSAERDTFMKEKEEYLESIQSKLRKLLFEEIALEDARKMYN